MKKISVFPVNTLKDREKVFETRLKGYRRYFDKIENVIDEHDYAPNHHLLLAVNEYGTPVGTMRLLDRRYGNIELDTFINVGNIIDECYSNSCVEVTRFAVPTNEYSKEIKTELYKAYYLYCWKNDIKAGVIWAKRAMVREYKWLGFESLGEKGKFKHLKLSNAPHETFILPFNHDKSWQMRHPLFKIVCQGASENIIVPENNVSLKNYANTFKIAV